MTQNHNLATPLAGVGGPSSPVWEVYPFRLALSCSEDHFHRERARICMKHGKEALTLVVDAMEEGKMWDARNEQQRAKDAKWIADAWRIPERDRAILNCCAKQQAL